jgi:TetR/AcrR family transcriptional repressor of nem operon
MKAAGMTHGGFYKHFADKDQLLQEAVQAALAQIAARLKGLATGLSRAEALKAIIDTYLSEEHMLHPEAGCALAAMGTEMARMPRAMKHKVSEALDAYAEQLDFLMPGDTAAQRRAAFLVLFPSMAGCIMAARAYADRERQREILAAGRAFFTAAFCSEPVSGLRERMQ